MQGGGDLDHRTPQAGVVGSGWLYKNTHTYIYNTYVCIYIVKCDDGCRYGRTEAFLCPQPSKAAASLSGWTARCL